MSDMTLAQRLTWTREQAGLSISQASQLTGINGDIITALESVGQIVPVTTFDVLAQSYDVDTRWLLTGVERQVVMPDTAHMSDEDRETLRCLLARMRQS